MTSHGASAQRRLDRVWPRGVERAYASFAMPVLTLPNPDSSSVRAKVLVFEDPSSRALLERIQQVAPSDATVLLCGETGTGKEIVARHVHELSTRRGRAFVGVNCGALPESLIESELFGHERGAFTGAVQSKVGWFETANGGTLFSMKLAISRWPRR